MNDITKAMHLDALRMTSEGILATLFMVVVSPLETLIYGGMLGKDGEYVVMGMIKLLLAIITVCYAMVIFYSEGKNDHYRINAILPVSRSSQVKARYLVMLAIDVIGMVEFAICVMLLFVVSGVAPTAHDVLMNGAVTLGAIVASQAILLPILYRFSSTQIITLLIFAFFLVGFGTWILGLLFENQIAVITAWLTTHIFVSMPLTVLFAAVLLVAAVAASLSISIRIYRRKEL